MNMNRFKDFDRLKKNHETLELTYQKKGLCVGISNPFADGGEKSLPTVTVPYFRLAIFRLYLWSLIGSNCPNVTRRKL